MQQRHSTVLKALAGLAFGLALTATSAQAQAQACVKPLDARTVTITVFFDNGQQSQSVASSLKACVSLLSAKLLGTSNGAARTSYRVELQFGTNKVICLPSTTETYAVPYDPNSTTVANWNANAGTCARHS
jgi:hypothetical protein